jgi:hypothetical protein
VRLLSQKNINSIPTIRDEDGIAAETYKQKAAILARTAFPPPIEYPGQYGCRRGQSAVDAVGVLTNEVQEALGRGRIPAALMMDVKSAFPSVAKECLVKKMREMGFDENLVEWTKSFMEERRVVIALV